MKRVLILGLLLVATTVATARPEAKKTYDVVRYSPPAGWKVEVKPNTFTSYTTTNKREGSYCQIFVFASVASGADIDADFATEWKTVMMPSFAVTDTPQMTEPAKATDWEAKGGVATFEFDHGTSVALLFTIRGFDRTASIVAVTNNAQAYLAPIQRVLASVDMVKPKPGAKVVAKPTARPAATSAAKPVALQGYMDYSPITQTWTWRLRQAPQ